MINALYVASLALVAVLVVALAAYLLAILVQLRSIRDTLGKVLFGVRAIAHRTAPVGPILRDITAELDTVAEALAAAEQPTHEPSASTQEV